jgi:hypothetical protein
VIAKVEWHPGELYPRVGFIVTNMARSAENVVAFYNKRGTCGQWIKEGKGSGGRGCRAAHSLPTPSDGFYVLLGPLQVGSHTVRFSARNPKQDFIQDVIYNLTVVPVSLQ